jgi:hypothetical protein
VNAEARRRIGHAVEKDAQAWWRMGRQRARANDECGAPMEEGGAWIECVVRGNTFGAARSGDGSAALLEQKRALGRIE